MYRGEVEGQKSLVSLGMYISFFPQLIAGPIVRYADFEKKLDNREVHLPQFSSGVDRFIIGFAKKVLIANNVGLIADKIFEIEISDLSTPLSWIGIVCYSLQIYYDFSGYSDMAIGLGKMFGFNFKENFAHPYTSRSIREFWRKWHISLSTWFRDYLYIPLGGSRVNKYRTYVNLIIVFFITGLWHGASWNFVVWGLFHGLFLILERLGAVNFLTRSSVLNRMYTLLIVMIGWVFFRSANLEDSVLYLSRMFSYELQGDNYPYLFLTNYTLFLIGVGFLCCLPVRRYIEQTLFKNSKLFAMIKPIAYLFLFVVSILELAQATYNPFIYFRF